MTALATRDPGFDAQVGKFKKFHYSILIKQRCPGLDNKPVNGKLWLYSTYFFMDILLG